MFAPGFVKFAWLKALAAAIEKLNLTVSVTLKFLAIEMLWLYVHVTHAGEFGAVVDRDHPVQAGSHASEFVVSIVVRNGFALKVCVAFGRSDLGARHHRPGRIENSSSYG